MRLEPGNTAERAPTGEVGHRRQVAAGNLGSRLHPRRVVFDAASGVSPTAHKASRLSFPRGLHCGSPLNQAVLSALWPTTMGAGFAEIAWTFISFSNNLSTLRCSHGRGRLVRFMSLLSLWAGNGSKSTREEKEFKHQKMTRRSQKASKKRMPMMSANGATPSPVMG